MALSPDHLPTDGSACFFVVSPFSSYKLTLKPALLQTTTLFVEGLRVENKTEVYVYRDRKLAVLQWLDAEGSSAESAMEAANDLLQTTLHVCKDLFGTLHMEVRDESNLECYLQQPSPTKQRIRPFLFAPMSIVFSGKTWYERHFNAYLKSETDRATYERVRAALQASLTTPFTTFASDVVLYEEQIAFLKPLYELSSTWSQLFQQIPQNTPCALLAWIPRFFQDHLGFHLLRSTWIIDLASQPPMDLLYRHTYTPLRSSTRRRATHTCRTRKQKYTYVVLNQFRGTIIC
jgi:hypothetical protein